MIELPRQILNAGGTSSRTAGSGGGWSGRRGVRTLGGARLAEADVCQVRTFFVATQIYGREHNPRGSRPHQQRLVADVFKDQGGVLDELVGDTGDNDQTGSLDVSELFQCTDLETVGQDDDGVTAGGVQLCMESIERDGAVS